MRRHHHQRRAAGRGPARAAVPSAPASPPSTCRRRTAAARRTGRRCPRHRRHLAAGQPAQRVEVAFGVALPDVDGQVGDPLRMLGVLSTAAPVPERPAGRVMASSTAVSTTARARRAISSAVPLRFDGSASTSAAGHAQRRLGRGQRGVHRAEVRQRVRVGGVVGGARVQRRGHRARPAEPARRDPTRRARTPAGSGIARRCRPATAETPLNWTERVSDSAIPALRQLLGSGRTPAIVQVDGEQTALTVVQPRRHQRMRAEPGARAPHLRAAQRSRSPSPRGTAPRRRGTRPPTHPTVARFPAGPPSSARIATASVCASASRPATTSVSVSSASRCHRCAVSPAPGSGSSSSPGSSQRPIKPPSHAVTPTSRLPHRAGQLAEVLANPPGRPPTRRVRGRPPTAWRRGRIAHAGRLEALHQVDVLAGRQRA